MLLSFLLKHLTSKRIRQVLKQGLAIVGSFYVLDISYTWETVFNYKSVKIDTAQIVGFLLLYFLIIALFYPLLNFLLRLFFFKILKKRVLEKNRELKNKSRVESLRLISDMRQSAVNFVIDYPINLGYIKPSEIEPIEELKPTDKEKEEAINEIISIILNWSCSFIHLIVTLLIVYNYFPVLMICFLIFGAILAVVITSGIILLIENIELVERILKHLHRRVS